MRTNRGLNVSNRMLTGTKKYGVRKVNNRRLTKTQSTLLAFCTCGKKMIESSPQDVKDGVTPSCGARNCERKEP